jgi:hypothetical protein
MWIQSNNSIRPNNHNKFKKIIFNTILGSRYYSSKSYSTPVVFLDADKDKVEIMEYVENKSGIYIWTNKLNNKNI